MKRKLICACLGLIAAASIFVACNRDDTQPSDPTGPIGGHTHSFSPWVLVTDATCEQEGVEARNCYCGEEETRTTGTLGHSFGKWKTDKAPTCTEAGVEKRVCSCGEEETKPIEVLPHSYGEWLTVKEPTCVEKGEQKRTCACGLEEQQELEMLPHDIGEWIIVKAATCTEPGSRTQKCSGCEEVVTEEIPATGHAPGEWVTTEATCTEDGGRYQICQVCDEQINDEVFSAVGHKPGEWVTTEATCTEDGIRYQYCDVCEEELASEVLPATGHTPGEWETTEPTCTATGVRRQYCVGCYKELNSEEIPVTEHKPGEWVTTGVTCTEPGVRKQYCIVCEKELDSEAVPAAGHTPGEWVATDVTCTEGGTRYQYCEVCKAKVNSEEVAPAEHTPGEWVTTGVTCTDAGVRKQYCTVCNKEINSETAPAAGHTPGEWVTSGVTCTSAGVRRQYCVVCYKEVNSEPVPASDHIPGEWVTTGVTCTKSGTRRQYCTTCNKELDWESVPATGHTPGDWVMADVTCTEGGTRYKYCEVCKLQVSSEKVAATGHTVGEWVTTGVTCTTAGSRSQYCTVCYKEINRESVPATGHTPGEWTVTTEPGCGTDGMRKLFCTSCNSELDSETLASVGHNFGAWDYSAPTCTEIGGRYQPCTRCGERFYKDEEPMLGHLYEDEWVVDKEPACAKAGSKSRHCTRCDDKTDVIEIPAIGHDDESTLPDKLCEGQLVRLTCKRCNRRSSARLQNITADVALSYRKYFDAGAKIQDILSVSEIKGGYGTYTVTITYINPKGETIRYQIPNMEGTAAEDIYLNDTGWSISERTATPPFVRVEIEDEIGFKAVYECYVPVLPSADYISGINDYADGVISFDVQVQGHKETEWKVSREATCTRTGVEQRVCTICNKVVESRKIDAGHDYVVAESAPTCESNGVTTVYCTKCTSTKSKEWTPITIEVMLRNFSSENAGKTNYYSAVVIKNITGGCVVYDSNGNIAENQYTITFYNVDTQEVQKRENIAAKTGIATGFFEDKTMGTLAPTYQVVVSDGRSSYAFYIWPDTTGVIPGIALGIHDLGSDAKCGREVHCRICGDAQHVPHEVMCGKCPKCEKTVTIPKILKPEPCTMASNKKAKIIACAVGGYAANDSYVDLSIMVECPKLTNMTYAPLLLCDAMAKDGWTAGVFICDMNGVEAVKNVYKKTFTESVIAMPQYSLLLSILN